MITAGDSAVGRSWVIEGEAEEDHSSWRKHLPLSVVRAKEFETIRIQI